MKLKTYLAILCVICLLSSLCITCYAAFTHTIDNDTVETTKYANTKNGFGWFQSTNCYNGDAEIHTVATSTNENYYKWQLKSAESRSGNMYVKLEVYLYYTSFTDPNAEYTLNQNGTTVYSTASGSFDQNLAAAGWNTVYTYTINASSLTGTAYTSEVKLEPSDLLASSYNKTFYCGADAIRITNTQ